MARDRRNVCYPYLFLLVETKGRDPVAASWPVINMLANYQTLTLPEPAIEETAGQFTARLSLLADEASAATGPAGLISD